MSNHVQLVEQAIHDRIRPHRSFMIAFAGVVIRGAMWAMVIFGLAAVIPRVLPALKQIQPKLTLPKGDIGKAIELAQKPEKTIPFVVAFLLLVDLPISYLASSSFTGRRWWSRLMFLLPVGVGLAAGAGFMGLYTQVLKMLMKDAGVGGIGGM